MSMAAARLSDRATAKTSATKNVHHVVLLRIPQLRRVFRRRHGDTFPLDDEGMRDRDIVLDHVVQSRAANAYQQALVFLGECCPWMLPAERTATIERAIERRKFWDKSELGNVLNLTWEERDECGATTIRPAGATDADMVRHRNVKEAARKKEERRAATLHPIAKLPLPAIRAQVIASVLKSGERCSLVALRKELVRTKQVRFANLRGKALATAVHNAVTYGVEQGFFRKDVDCAGRLPVAWITKVKDLR